MKILFISFLMTLSSVVLAGTTMKLEGSCSGKINQETVSFNYYSTFDGCKNKSNAALSFTSGHEGLYTGLRSFKGNKDIYELGKKQEKLGLEFLNSTGNVSGKLKYNKKIINVKCEIRDYEYGECA